MLIKAMALENFKGIREPVRIEFKPVTLLFGPNSAGKSTILQALVYTREIMERHNLDADRTLLGGEWLDLGGFQSLVHNHVHLDRSITIGFELDLSNQDLPDYLSDSEGFLLEAWEYGRTPDVWLATANFVEFKLSIQWSNLINRPIVEKVHLNVDGQLLAEIRSSQDTKNIAIQFLNVGHPMFRDKFSSDGDPTLNWFGDELLASAFVTQHRILQKIGEESKEEPEDSEPEDSSKVDNDILESLNTIFADVSPDQMDQALRGTFTTVYRGIGLVGQVDALPLRGQALQLDSSVWTSGDQSFDPYRSHSLESDLLITSVFSGVIVGPIDLICSQLDKLLYLGPFREIPPRHHQPTRSPDLSHWARGLAAWDILMLEGKALTDRVNSWLEDDIHIGAPYRIEARAYKQIDMEGPLYRTLVNAHNLEDELMNSNLLDEYLSDAPIRRELKIVASDSGTHLEPADLGVGISQLIPVIVATLYAKSSLITIEQPELHIHPAWQVVLGDLFLSQIREKEISFLIETHSEHLMLRLLRRVRETTENELPPGSPAASVDDIAVYYVAQTEGRTTFEPLRIDSSGEFVDKWPNGFFEERAEELF